MYVVDMHRVTLFVKKNQFSSQICLKQFEAIIILVFSLSLLRQRASSVDNHPRRTAEERGGGGGVVVVAATVV